MCKCSLALSFILIYIVLFSSGSQGASWQNMGGDLQHSGYAQSPAVPLDMRWKYKIGASDISAPVIDGGILFIGSEDNNLYAIDAITGKLKWSYSMFGRVFTPTAKNNMVFAASFDNYIYALDYNGNLKWKYNTGSSISSPPVIYNNNLYGGFDRYIYAIYINNGSLNWKYQTEDFIESTPAIAQGTVYIGSNDDYIYALDAENKNLRWKYKTKGSISSSPSVIKGKIFIGSKDSSIYAIDASKGELQWSEKTNDGVTSSPAVFENSVYIGSNDNTLYALNIDNGDIIWKFNTNDRIDSSPVVTDDMVYAGSRDGTIYTLGHTGVLINKYTLGSGIKSLALSDNMLFAASQDGYIYAFGAPVTETPGPLPTRLPDSTPPELKIDPIPLETYSQKLIVSGTARDPGGILVVTVNGINAGAANWNTSLMLSNGTNTITIVAVDKAGNINTEQRTVTYIAGAVSQGTPKAPGFYTLYVIVGFLAVAYVKKYINTDCL